MRKSIKIWLLLALVCLAMTARAQGEDDVQLRYRYFSTEAMRQRLQGKDNEALQLALHALEINPQADEMHMMVSDYLVGVNDSLSLAHLKRAIELNPSNATYKEQLAGYYIQKKDYAAAIEIFEQQCKENGPKINTLTLLTNLYYATKNYEMALDALSRQETKVGVTRESALKKMQLYEQLGDTAATHQVLKGLVEDNDEEPAFKVMLGNWLVKRQRYDEAATYLTGALEQSPDNYDALSSLYDYYKATAQDSLAADIMDRMLVSEDTPVKTRTRFMASCLRNIYNQKEEGDTIAALAFLDNLIKRNPNDSIAAYNKMAFLNSIEAPDSVRLKAMEHFLDIVPDDAATRLEQSQLYWKADNWPKVAESTQVGMQYNADELVFYYLNAIYQIHEKNDKGAIDVAHRGLKKRGAGTNPKLIADLYSLVGDLEHGLNHAQKCYEAYDSCLVYNPDHTSTLNNYAYFISLDTELKGENIFLAKYKDDFLAKAEQMSKKTIIAEPENSTYLDTYAWILFKQKRYDEALEYMERCIAAMKKTDISENSENADGNENPDNADETLNTLINPSNTIILDHAGDIYYMNKMVDKAVEYWEMALACSDKPSKTLKKKAKKRKL